MRGRMPVAARERFEAERDRGSGVAGPDGWEALKVAHVLSQPWAGPHVPARRPMPIPPDLARLLDSGGGGSS